MINQPLEHLENNSVGIVLGHEDLGSRQQKAMRAQPPARAGIVGYESSL